MAKILLVEDDESIREGLKFSFEQSPHELLTAQNLKEAKAIALGEGLGLVLLDVSLPDGNGFDFYKSLLIEKEIPTIFLTARDDEEDIVKGLNLGAEDYITKPFSIRELMARINRVIVRHAKNAVLKIGDVTVDIHKMEFSKEGKPITFSSLENKILKLFIDNRNKVVSRNAVIDCIWEATGNDVFDHTVTVYIKRIREKLGNDAIKTVKGMGYRLDVEE